MKFFLLKNNNNNNNNVFTINTLFYDSTTYQLKIDMQNIFSNMLYKNIIIALMLNLEIVITHSALGQLNW